MMSILALQLVTLHYGICDEDGVVHREVELGPLSTAAWFDLSPARADLRAAQATPDAPAAEGAGYAFALATLPYRIKRIGTLPPFRVTTAYLRERLQLADLELLITEVGLLDQRIERFRLDREAAAQAPHGDRPADGLVPG